MKIALAQMSMSRDMNENAEKSLSMLKEAAGKGADLILFPEIQLSPFFPKYEKSDASEYILEKNDALVRRFQTACREQRVFASPNFYIRENENLYDMSLLIDDDGRISGEQKMVHIAQNEFFYEQDYYTPSEEGFQVLDTRLGKIGIVVCFDRHYPESVRTEALRGADLILIPTANTKGEPSDLFEWEIRIQAFQNSVNVAMCNRTGEEDMVSFSGESLVTDYNGRRLAMADDREQIVYADIDMDGARKARERKPYTSLRRPELYE